MSKKTLKEMRIAAEAALEKGVANKATLAEAVPVLVELQEAVSNAYRTARECTALAEALSEACSRYGLAHESIFDEGLSLSQVGVKSGDLTIDDVTYHFASGYDKPKRTDGGMLTQDYLGSLPKDWVKGKLELDTTGINRLGVSEEDLEKNGLYRPEKNEWSVER